MLTLQIKKLGNIGIMSCLVGDLCSLSAVVIKYKPFITDE